MAKGKFFNVDLENNNPSNNESRPKRRKYFQNGLDFSEDDKKLLLTILGVLCAVGFLYYVIMWLLQK